MLPLCSISSIPIVAEEDPVALMPDLGKNAVRGICGVGYKRHAPHGGVPLHGRTVFPHHCGKSQVRIADLDQWSSAAPFDVEGNRRRVERAVADRVWDVAVVSYREIRDAVRRLASAKIYVHAVGGDGDCPEESAGIGRDTEVEIVDLGREVSEVILTSIEVNSNKADCAPVWASIDSDIHAFHEPHIGVHE